MKVFKKALFISIAVILIAVIFFVAINVYADRFMKSEVYREASPDGEFQFVLYQVGQPGWAFGPVKAQLCVLDSNGKTVDKESIVIHTDGAQLNECYLDEINWGDTALEVVCRGEDGTATYVLELNHK